MWWRWHLSASSCTAGFICSDIITCDEPTPSRVPRLCPCKLYIAKATLGEIEPSILKRCHEQYETTFAFSNDVSIASWTILSGTNPALEWLNINPAYCCRNIYNLFAFNNLHQNCNSTSTHCTGNTLITDAVINVIIYHLKHLSLTLPYKSFHRPDSIANAVLLSLSNSVNIVTCHSSSRQCSHVFMLSTP